MKLDITSPAAVAGFLDTVRISDPEIVEFCRLEIDKLVVKFNSSPSPENQFVPYSKIKRLARQQSPAHREAMDSAMAVAASVIRSELVHGENLGENTQGKTGGR